jgi:hypothetical protein
VLGEGDAVGMKEVEAKLMRKGDERIPSNGLVKFASKSFLSGS